MLLSGELAFDLFQGLVQLPLNLCTMASALLACFLVCARICSSEGGSGSSVGGSTSPSFKARSLGLLGCFCQGCLFQSFCLFLFQGGSLSHGGPWPPHCKGFRIFPKCSAPGSLSCLEALTTLEYFWVSLYSHTPGVLGHCLQMTLPDCR